MSPECAQNFHQGNFLPSIINQTNLEDVVVKGHHDKAGDVEGAQGGADDEVRIVKSTNERLWGISERTGRRVWFNKLLECEL